MHSQGRLLRCAGEPRRAFPEPLCSHTTGVLQCRFRTLGLPENNSSLPLPCVAHQRLKLLFYGSCSRCNVLNGLRIVCGFAVLVFRSSLLHCLTVAWPDPLSPDQRTDPLAQHLSYLEHNVHFRELGVACAEPCARRAGGNNRLTWFRDASIALVHNAHPPVQSHVSRIVSTCCAYFTTRCSSA